MRYAFSLLCLLLVSCAPKASEPDDAGSLVVRPLNSPAGDRSGQPRMTRGADGRTYLSWIEKRQGKSSLLFSTLEGRQWSTPKIIASGTNWFVNWADVPSIAASENGTLASHWLERTGKGPYAYGIRISISRDHGSSWGNPFWLHRDRKPAEHGFASLVALNENRFAAVWLDGNDLERREEMELRATTFDEHGKLSDEKVIDSRVCECCATSAVATEAGALFVAYRDRGPTEIRDIYGSVFAEGAWSPPSCCHDDRWKTPG